VTVTVSAPARLKAVQPGAAPSKATAIDLKGVGKTFRSRDGRTVQALSPLDLEVREGEFVAIVGTSGCGKSTLMRIIAGLMEPSLGTVIVDGEKVSGPHSSVGIIFQTPVLLPWRTVRQNIELQLQIRGRSRDAAADAVQNLIRLVGLEGFEEKHPFELSGGMQQRVSLCRALIHEPKLLLADEPFGALDAMTREQMNSELQRIWAETGKTVVFITHSITEAVFLADRIVVMSPRPGRVTDIVSVTLPRPRDFTSVRDPLFHEACDRVRSTMNATGMVE
jgi:NitT/TauT family transport system ATP-binding protein